MGHKVTVNAARRVLTGTSGAASSAGGLAASGACRVLGGIHVRRQGVPANSKNNHRSLSAALLGCC